MKYFLTGLLITVCASGIVAIFWQQELKYGLPTPIPQNYKVVAVGAKVQLPNMLQYEGASFLHFYNPDCPCSRFNGKHLKSLIRSYSDSVRILIVVPNTESIAGARKELGNTIEMVVDNDQAIATACGVYSTPQAVIINQQQQLYFRGNYNRARYCTVRATNFAELSLIAMLNHQQPPSFGLNATQSYGCSLNEATQNDFEFY